MSGYENAQVPPVQGPSNNVPTRIVYVTKKSNLKEQISLWVLIIAVSAFVLGIILSIVSASGSLNAYDEYTQALHNTTSDTSSNSNTYNEAGKNYQEKSTTFGYLQRFGSDLVTIGLLLAVQSLVLYVFTKWKPKPQLPINQQYSD